MNMLKELLTSENTSSINFGSLLFIEEIEKIIKDYTLYRIAPYEDFGRSKHIIYILYKGDFNITIQTVAIDINYDLDRLPEYLNNLPVEI